MAIKTPAEIAVEFAQAVVSTAPVIILGSGASAAHGIPGMWDLGVAIFGAAKHSAWDAVEIEEWDKFTAQIGKGVDLETAMADARLSERQTDYVVRTTRSLLLPSDLKVLESLLVDRRALPLSRLYTHLFRSTHTKIDVITSNYDRLAEYAADAADVAHFTGFTHGYLQSRASDPGTRLHARGRPVRTVCVWKVHGSLSWHQSPSREILGMTGGIEPPADFRPLIVTPGLGKYRLTHDEPFRTILASADAAIDAARSYLCIGYGFNDEHLQTKLVERCEHKSVPLVIITKGLTDSTKRFLSSGRSRFLALEQCPGGTRAWSHDEPGGFEIPNVAYWRLPDFLDMTIGALP